VAVGRNPVCLLVPSHRVAGAGGKLTGYASGLARKQFPLDLEVDVAGERASRSEVAHVSPRRNVYIA
jgi:methylated-DNA-[protein]-cysteine S-methyltransferase